VVKSGFLWENSFYIRPTNFYASFTMINLFGVYESTVDAKGRVMLPAPFRKSLENVLEEGFIIKQNVFRKSLELFPLQSWNEVSQHIGSLNTFQKSNQELITLFYYGVRSVELDNNARLLIVKDHLTYAGIKKDIVMAGAKDRIEVWDKRAYHKYIKDNNANLERLIEEKLGGKLPENGK
jgi:MraZ protein